MKSIKISAALLAIVFATATAFTAKPAATFASLYWYTTTPNGAFVTGVVSPSNSPISRETAKAITGCPADNGAICCAKAYINKYTGSFPVFSTTPGNSLDNVLKP